MYVCGVVRRNHFIYFAISIIVWYDFNIPVLRDFVSATVRKRVGLFIIFGLSQSIYFQCLVLVSALIDIVPCGYYRGVFYNTPTKLDHFFSYTTILTNCQKIIQSTSLIISCKNIRQCI